MTETGGPGDFQLIRDTLLRFDPETRHQVIETMRVLRELPVPAAVRILAEAGMRAQATRRQSFIRPGET